MTPKETEILIELRHRLHACAELSGMENSTGKVILDFFSELKPDRIVKIAGTGLIFTFKSRNSLRNVLLRTEMDALPIPEKKNFSYRSANEGVSHKCGHDGHMAILAGVGKWCSENRLENADIHLVFQPAEETGQGARAIRDSSEFDIIPDFCFAIHNIPGFRTNSIILRENIFSASVISLIISLGGRTAHAAEPENGINPALAVAEIISVLDKLNQPDSKREDFFLCTPVFIRMGEQAFGTAAGQAKLGFTLRCWNNELLKETQATVRSILEQIADMNDLYVGLDWTEEFYANYNDQEAILLIRKSAEKLGLAIEYLDQPFRWGEDFGFFTSRYPGAMAGIGAGLDSPALHHQDYDFPDEIIGTGVALTAEILQNIDQQ
jgi:amidohydrolase